MEDKELRKDIERVCRAHSLYKIDLYLQNGRISYEMNGSGDITLKSHKVAVSAYGKQKLVDVTGMSDDDANRLLHARANKLLSKWQDYYKGYARNDKTAAQRQRRRRTKISDHASDVMARP